ncbi:MAG: hypothetical protein HQL03_13775, partial [Nitrospirae bacterium]|nr:hypothetical protein [Nitrospirota bacterium]
MEVLERVESLEETVAWFVREMREARREDNEAWEKKMEAWEKKIEEQQKERIADRREWNKKWGETANRLGTLVEDIVAPNIEGLALGYFGCKRIDVFAPRIKKTSVRDRSKLREFD